MGLSGQHLASRSGGPSPQHCHCPLTPQSLARGPPLGPEDQEAQHWGRPPARVHLDRVARTATSGITKDPGRGCAAIWGA